MNAEIRKARGKHGVDIWQWKALNHDTENAWLVKNQNLTEGTHQI